jgi:hypothetical protein
MRANPTQVRIQKMHNERTLPSQDLSLTVLKILVMNKHNVPAKVKMTHGLAKSSRLKRSLQKNIMLQPVVNLYSVGNN